MTLVRSNCLQFLCELHFTKLTCTDIDSPIQFSAAATGGTGPEPNPEQVAMLADMGFSSAQARKALRETVSHDISSLRRISH